MDNLACLS